MNRANAAGSSRTARRAAAGHAKQPVDRRADEERRRLRAALEQELRVVEDVLLAPVGGDVLAELPQHADRVVFGPIAPRADGVEQDRVQAPRRLDRRRPRHRVLAVRVAPGQHRLQPALRLAQGRGVGVRHAEHAGDDRDRQQPGQVVVQLEGRPSRPGRRCVPRRAAGRRASRSGAMGSGRQACDTCRCSASCRGTDERAEVAPARRSPRRPGSVPVGSANRSSRRSTKVQPSCDSTSHAVIPSSHTTGPTPASPRRRDTDPRRAGRATRSAQAAVDRPIGGRHTTTASMPRWRATASTSAAKSPGVAELWWLTPAAAQRAHAASTGPSRKRNAPLAVPVSGKRRARSARRARRRSGSRRARRDAA